MHNAVLKLLFVIIDWNKLKVVSKVFEQERIRFHFVSKGKGTASSDILDVLGIGSSEKAVILCLEQDGVAPFLIQEVRKKLGVHSVGAGIAFTVPLSGINNLIFKLFKEAGTITKPETLTAQEGNTREGDKVSTQIKNDLIISIINQGYSDEFMTVAREAGATGGTVINARGLDHQKTVKFFGVSIQNEKEIIIMLTSRDRKVPIMQAVSQAYGITTEAEGLVFSLPVDKVMGLNVNLD
jgi:nitrogen regulatory protein PII